MRVQYNSEQTAVSPGSECHRALGIIPGGKSLEEAELTAFGSLLSGHFLKVCRQVSSAVYTSLRSDRG